MVRETFFFWSSSSRANPDSRSNEFAWVVDLFYNNVTLYNKRIRIKIWPSKDPVISQILTGLQIPSFSQRREKDSPTGIIFSFKPSGSIIIGFP
jgi:hypothetical protein